MLKSTKSYQLAKNPSEVERSTNHLFRKIFKNSIGPDSKSKKIALYCKGFLMGSADTVPGVSGGTVAYLTGIYQELLEAIGSFDKTFLQHLKDRKFEAALTHIHTKFLVILFGGILTAILSMARIVTYCLHNHSEITFSFFLGLMIASIIVVIREINKWNISLLLVFISTTLLTFWLVGKSPASSTNDLSYFYIFFCGCISICAMLLPGISGSYLLLILGAYHSILASVKSLTSPSSWQNGFEDIRSLWPPLILLCFLIGCATGIKSFSKLLSYLLKHHHQVMVSFICGLMVGALRSIWPWQSRPDLKHDLSSSDKTVIYWLPEINAQFWYGLIFGILGFILIIWMELHFKKDKTIS